MAKDLKRTPLISWHKEHGGQMVEFAGWEMPVAYATGIIEEHLRTRRYGGLFDISHMGRFLIQGEGAIPFLEHVLTNNALALEHGMAQYTLIQNENGGAIDDAYLYRLDEGYLPSESRYLLVVNAANKDKDWEWLIHHKKRFKNFTLEDKSEEIGMMALQGPLSKGILEKILIKDHTTLPDPWRNRLRVSEVEGIRIAITISRTGYTGEPICFELFVHAEKMRMVWEKILATGEKDGIVPVGLGARDTLRLEAGLPLYGHELGLDHDGEEIPIYAVPSAALAVSFSPLKGGFIGKEALRRQFKEIKLRMGRLPLPPDEKQVVPKRIFSVAISGKGIGRQGYEVFRKGEKIGHVTSGTMVPYWIFPDEGIRSNPSDEKGMRPITLACVNSDLEKGDKVEIQQRGKTIESIVVERHLSGEAPPYARPILIPGLPGEIKPKEHKPSRGLEDSAEKLVQRVIQNNHWRQRKTINLIPSEATPSLLVSLLTIMDPSHRYAEHRTMKAFGEKEVFYYQGTKLIEEVEELLVDELRRYFGCSEVEMRVISGQMANTAVFSGLVDYLNRLDRKSEPRRIRKVMNQHLGRGGHLSAQPMGALRDFVAHDPQTERPAVVPFPVLKEDPYQIDLLKTEELLAIHKPELIVLGKSMVIYKEPLKEISQLISGMRPKPIIHYDMAHVLGLIGPYFQEPFQEGADIVTGSTHKTFFGPQRGVIASNMSEGTEYEDLWEAIVRRVFPGSVSNHHLGTLVGLLMATYEMNAYRLDFQKAVISNAKAFARALKDQGLMVEGDPRIGFTETHQVILRVGYGKGSEVAHRLEENNIVLNYQGAPDDEAFTAASCLRMGVQEMTRFGMKEGDFPRLAEYMKEIIVHNKPMAKEVSQFRGKFTEMKYCLPEKEAASLVERLWEAIR
ncbi:MAG: glycine cleavage system protein T [Deltaproteobacteria bacterium RBG_16_48_10]|nr:MAG: glycine cleavage system protein T [Deltaproteobacteria bacterium RBG_16_48_10]